jgi:hypothetical protein
MPRLMDFGLRSGVPVCASLYSSVGARCRICRAGLVALGLSVLGGCGSIEVALGLRTRLDKVPVAALSASLSPEALSPGESGRLVIVATTTDGKAMATVGAGHGKVLFDSFTFDASVAAVNKKGVVSLSADPRISDGRMPHVRISAIGHPEVVAELDIPVRYDAAFTAHFSGRPGFNGTSGLDGLSGSDGAAGSADLNNPSAGGRGSDGTNGGDGQDGGAGEPGQTVHLWMTLKPDSHTLLQVRAASPDHEQFFLVDTNGGSLAIDASGGRGGSGGSGGRGGRGGSGGIGFPNGFSGSDGRDGSNGRAGRDGAAGAIVVSVDPLATQFLDRIHFANESGSGAAGPAPEVRIEPVPALW